MARHLGALHGCGHRQRAEVLGIGIGQETFLNSSGTARRRDDGRVTWIAKDDPRN